MKKTIISHFYNEEYLLPWWLRHHQKYFDHGIMIDYHSTDNSRKIINRICPKWDIITSRNKNFEAGAVDAEVVDIESWVDGWKIVLNTTEFIVSTQKDWQESKVFENYDQIIIPCHVMVDNNLKKQDLKYDTSLIKQKNIGINVHVKPVFANLRFSRSMHRKKVVYSCGRHFDGYTVLPEFVKKFKDGTTTTIFNILWYGFSPYNQRMLKRKLQIQHVMPHNGFGVQHITTKERLDKIHQNHLKNAGKMTFLTNQRILTY